MAPLTGIAVAINWLIGKLNLKIGVVKTTRMTTFKRLTYNNISEASTYSRRRYD